MSHHTDPNRLLVGTRKGLFELRDDQGDRWRVARHSHHAIPVTLTLADPRDGALYAALDHGHFGTKLQRSDDGGATWRELPAPSFPADVYDKKGGKRATVGGVWALAAGGDGQTGRLWAGTLSGGLFRSDDGGSSWALNDALWSRPERAEWFGGGADTPAIHSVLVDPRDADHVTVGVSCGGVWQSRDSGQTWTLTADGMFAAYMPPDRRGDPRIQDPHCVVACPARPDVLWCQHHNGIFRSVDGGISWQDVEPPAPAGFGFPVAAHPSDPDTAWFVPAISDEQRMPADGQLVVARTRDGGETFEFLRDGLPQSHAYDLVYRHALALGEDGKTLLFGSTTGNLYASRDGGDSWKVASHNLPPIYSVRLG